MPQALRARPLLAPLSIPADPNSYNHAAVYVCIYMASTLHSLARFATTRLHRPRGQERYEVLTSQAVSTAVPPRLEGVMVRVLGTLVKAAPSAERMEACAAVAKASRPEVTHEFFFLSSSHRDRHYPFETSPQFKGMY